MNSELKETSANDSTLIFLGLLLFAISSHAHYPWQQFSCMVAQMMYLGFWCSAYLSTQGDLRGIQHTPGLQYITGFTLWAVTFLLQKNNII